MLFQHQPVQGRILSPMLWINFSLFPPWEVKFSAPLKFQSHVYFISIEVSFSLERWGLGEWEINWRSLLLLFCWNPTEQSGLGHSYIPSQDLLSSANTYSSLQEQLNPPMVLLHIWAQSWRGLSGAHSSISASLWYRTMLGHSGMYAWHTCICRVRCLLIENSEDASFLIECRHEACPSGHPDNFLLPKMAFQAIKNACTCYSLIRRVTRLL